MSVTRSPAHSALRTGYLAGIAAYGLWGFFPLYFPLLEPASAAEILAHRIVWSLLVCVVLVVVIRGWRKIRAILASPRTLALLLIASALICANWGIYIWAVNAGHVVEASLGYFINPLISVLMGVVLLRERLRSLQWWAFGVAAVAVVVLTVGYGRLPWIALLLALSFGGYGLCKKLAGAESVPSLTVETAAAAPFALLYLAYLQANGTMSFGHSSVGNTVLIAVVGVVTVIPLLAFNASATRIPLSALGLMQYLTPVIQFLLGVLVFQEHMPPARWIGFGIVWAALVIFTIDALRNTRRPAVVSPDL